MRVRAWHTPFITHPPPSATHINTLVHCTRREDETLAKLSSFTSGLFSKRRETGGGSKSMDVEGEGAEEEKKGKGKVKEAYHGQVRWGEED